MIDPDKLAEWRRLAAQSLINVPLVVPTLLDEIERLRTEVVEAGADRWALGWSRELSDKLATVEKERDELRGVVDVAIAWRDTWRHRRPFGDESKAVALVDAVDALAKERPDA